MSEIPRGIAPGYEFAATSSLSSRFLSVALIGCLTVTHEEFPEKDAQNAQEAQWICLQCALYSKRVRQLLYELSNGCTQGNRDTLPRWNTRGSNPLSSPMWTTPTTTARRAGSASTHLYLFGILVKLGHTEKNVHPFYEHLERKISDLQTEVKDLSFWPRL